MTVHPTRLQATSAIVMGGSLQLPLSIDPKQISISGLSSGADMTVQVQVRGEGVHTVRTATHFADVT